MNIGIVTTWFERGAALVSRAYMETLSREHSVFIFARGGEWYGRGNPRWDLPNVTWASRLPRHRTTSFIWDEFHRWVQENKLDAVIFNEQQVWTPLLRCLDLDVLLGAYVDYYTSATPPFFRLYDFLLCNTRRHHSVFRDHPRALFIPWGTDLGVFRPRPRPGAGKTLTFFHSYGVDAWRKGTGVLIEAFRQVKGDARLIIHSQNGVSRFPYLEPLLRQDARIQVIEGETPAPGLYHLGDVYAYPTKLEGIGLTVTEALACGLPVITTDVAPVNELVEHGVNGRLVRVEAYARRFDDYCWPEATASRGSLTQAMQWYVDHQSERERWKADARRYAEEHLDWSRNSACLPKALPNMKRSPERPHAASLIEAVRRFERSANRRHALFLARIYLGKAGGTKAKAMARSALERMRRRAAPGPNL